MPDGHNYIQANQIIYKNVTRKHSGTYICEGSNGPGQIVSDEIQVDILRKLLIMSFKGIVNTHAYVQFSKPFFHQKMNIDKEDRYWKRRSI